ncbi:hypothetical protein F2P81_016052 [Scophthalmus maximus]|uniref:Uncharacterized protein n=1 Tax=Scophthalmus maximus TaxID=52904 RepID=A0A6A4SE54_SCOMX|nr:hypothetical protein F2P81_016052 [Scophthalmus maximus]
MRTKAGPGTTAHNRAGARPFAGFSESKPTFSIEPVRRNENENFNRLTSSSVYSGAPRCVLCGGDKRQRRAETGLHRAQEPRTRLRPPADPGERERGGLPAPDRSRYKEDLQWIPELSAASFRVVGR